MNVMRATLQKRINAVMAVLFTLSALVIALLVSLQGQAEGRGWLASVIIGAAAGVVIAYSAVLVLLTLVAVAFRVTKYFEKR